MDSLRETGLGTAHQFLMAGGDGTATEGIVLALRPAAVLNGQVSLRDGKPVPPGTRITLSREETRDNQQAVVGSDGRFRFQGVPVEEDLRLLLRVPGYHLASGIAGLDARRGQVRLCVPAGQPNPTVSLPLEPGDR
jgi:hypothetical protein